MSHGHYRFPPRSTHLDEAEISFAVNRFDTCQRVDTMAITNVGPGQLDLCIAVKTQSAEAILRADDPGKIIRHRC